jgi:hypothetical protein
MGFYTSNNYTSLHLSNTQMLSSYLNSGTIFFILQQQHHFDIDWQYHLIHRYQYENFKLILNFLRNHDFFHDVWIRSRSIIQ